MYFDSSDFQIEIRKLWAEGIGVQFSSAAAQQRSHRLSTGYPQSKKNDVRLIFFTQGLSSRRFLSGIARISSAGKYENKGNDRISESIHPMIPIIPMTGRRAWKQERISTSPVSVGPERLGRGGVVAGLCQTKADCKPPIRRRIFPADSVENRIVSVCFGSVPVPNETVPILIETVSVLSRKSSCFEQEWSCFFPERFGFKRDRSCFDRDRFGFNSKKILF